MTSQQSKIDKKAAEAKRLYQYGMTQKEIATTLKVHVNTVQRYLERGAQEEATELATIDPSHIEELLAVGHPLLVALLKDIEKLLEEEKLSPRDTMIAFGIVSDKLGRLARTNSREQANEVDVLKGQLIVAKYNEAVAVNELRQLRQEMTKQLNEDIDDTEVIEDGELVEDTKG